MMARCLLLLLAAGVAAAETSESAKPAAPLRPNIIFNLVDDLGWNDVSWHREGGNIVKTPYLEGLANTGTKLQNYYIYRFCSPSRSTFMTGRHPSHIGQQTKMNLNPMPGVACGINLKYDFIAEVLRRAGYKTAALGKWHLGYQSNAYTPTYRGFDTYTGYYSGAEEHFTHYKAGEGKNYFDLANNSGNSVAPLFSMVGKTQNETEEYYSVYVYGNETVRLIKRHAALYASSPLYVYLAWNVVHAPDEAPAWAVDLNPEEKNGQRQLFAGMLSALDVGVRHVIDELKAQDMWEKTIFVFSADNGGNLGGGGNNLPLRGGKYTFWEGGTRGVGFIHSPLLGPNPPPEWHGLMHAVDWYTTFAGLAGASVENTGPLPADGINIWDDMKANQTDPSRHMIIQYASFAENGSKLLQPEGVVRRGDWKLISGYPGWQNPLWNGHFKLPSGPDDSIEGWEIAHTHVPFDGVAASNCSGEDGITGAGGESCCVTQPCLFNMADDREENHDIAAANPTIVKELQEIIAGYAASEVSIQASGLCPTQYGTGNDPRCAEAAAKITPPFWVPWLKDGEE